MRYKNINLLFILAFLASAGLYNAGYAKAQGVVTLANDDAMENSDSSGEIPDEISLFSDNIALDEEIGGDDGLIIPPKKNDMPVLDTSAQNSALPNFGAEDELDENILEEEIVIPAPRGVANINTNFGSAEENIGDDLFSKMSDLEKQTALLSLELRREKVQNEIEAVKSVRKSAEEQEKAKEEERIKKKIEWEKEQEAKIIQEQQKLRELDIKFEKQRQEKILNSYKDEMLKENFGWIDNNQKIYDALSQEKEAKSNFIKDVKNKFIQLDEMALRSQQNAIQTKQNHEKEVNDLQTQISILKARIEAQERERERERSAKEAKDNPFAEGAGSALSASDMQIESLSKTYAIMEIRGQGGELVAKVINKDGMPFMVKKGTVLQTGHTVDEITSTYVRALKDGMKDFLYFAAGGILDKEPLQNIETYEDNTKEEVLPPEAPSRGVMSSVGVPGLGKDMIVR